MKRYEFVSPAGSGGRIREDAEGMWVSVIDARHAISARDARIAELERHLAACEAELRARREYADACNGERFISEQAWEHARKKIDELRAATDAAGGVA